METPACFFANHLRATIANFPKANKGSACAILMQIAGYLAFAYSPPTNDSEDLP